MLPLRVPSIPSFHLIPITPFRQYLLIQNSGSCHIGSASSIPCLRMGGDCSVLKAKLTVEGRVLRSSEKVWSSDTALHEDWPWGHRTMSSGVFDH